MSTDSTGSECSIDLHTHSNRSDGSCTPAELIALAAEAGLAAVALTDHDTTAGIPEFLEAARSYPELEAIAGVELSTAFGAREMHIVGLYLDPDAPTLKTFLAAQREARTNRNELIRLKLNTLGYPLRLDDPAFSAVSDAASIGRPHFARALMNNYGFPSLQSVFEKLLKRGAPAFVPRKLPDPVQAIEAVHAAGGIAVWAHPVYRERNERAFARRILKRFQPLGLDAVEGYYSLFGPGETKMITELAELYGLALSGGSDFHGKNSPGIALGSGAGKLRVPAALLAPLRAARSRRQSEPAPLPDEI